MDEVPRRVLLVAQSSTFRDQLLAALAGDGYRVDCASDGAEALTVLEGRPLPQAIVVDLVLPRACVVAIKNAQLQSPELGRVPTIALSAVRPLPGTEDLTFQAVVSKVSALDRLGEVLALCAGSNVEPIS